MIFYFELFLTFLFFGLFYWAWRKGKKEQLKEREQQTCSYWIENGEHKVKCWRK